MTAPALPLDDSPAGSMTRTPDAPPARLATGLWGALFGFLCLLMVLVGVETALHFVGPAIDGPFQLYNALRRIWAGQRAGVDFQFFHGLGIPYLHYLPFRLLGGTFFASEMTRELVSAILYPLTIVVFLRRFIGATWARVLAWSAIVMAASIALRMTSVLVAVNSLLGVRSTLPVVMPILLCLDTRRSVRNVACGLTLGLALVMSTEQGLALTLALLLIGLIWAWRARRLAHFWDTSFIIALGLATLVVVLVLLGGVSGMRGALAYNFRLVPMDQYWYFGAPPNLFLSSWSVIPRMLMVIPRIPEALAIGCAAVVFTAVRLGRQPNRPAARREAAFAVLACYGLISCTSLLGTFANAYIQPLLRVLLLLGAVYADAWLSRRDLAAGRRLLGVGQSVVLVAAVTLLLMSVKVTSIYAVTTITLPHVIKDHLFGHEGAGYAGIWPETLQQGQAILDSRRAPDGSPPTLWSTYAGLLEARNGMFNPTFDYIIHALGPRNRAAYVATFTRDRPRLVQTVRPLYTQYEAWIEGTSWDFYLELLRNYDVVNQTPWSFFWERRATPTDAPVTVWSATVAPRDEGVQLPTVPPGAPGEQYVLLDVELQYHAKNILGTLPIVGSMPRYLLSAANAVQKNPITLDPYVTTAHVPLIAIRGKAPALHWQTFSLLPGASIAVTGVRLSVVPLTPANAAWLRELITEQLSEMHQ